MIINKATVITLNKIIDLTRKYFEDYIKTTKKEYERLSTVLEEDDKCWVGVEGIDGHWTELPNRRTLSMHWNDSTKFFDLKHVMDNFVSKYDSNNIAFLITYSGNVKYNVNRVCSNGHILGLDEEFLYLELDPHDEFVHQGIQLCKKCVKEYLEMLKSEV